MLWVSQMFVRECWLQALILTGLAGPWRRFVNRSQSIRPIAWLTQLAGRGVRVARALVRKVLWAPRALFHVCLRSVYRFVAGNFFRLMYPVNYALSILLRRRKFDNSVLHISYMVHIPWYTTRILRKHGMKADYLAVGGESPWWKQFDLHFPRNWPPLFWQEWWFFWKVMSKYEVVHSHFGIQLSASGWELPHLKRMGRKIVVHYRGCEVRDPDALQKQFPTCNICSLCDYNGSVCGEGRARVDRANAVGDAFLVTTPDMQDFEPGAIHFPFFTPEIDYREYRASAPPFDGRRPLRIVHATNHPGIEGTARIQHAIDRLVARGYDIEFEFLRGKTPDEVLRAIQSADLTIGKMKMGYYANTQIESMFLGVPAITWVRPEFMTPELEASGLIFSDLDGLEQTIAWYYDHPDELAHKRSIARRSILELHDNDRLAAKLRRIYREVLGETVTDEQEAAWADRPLRVLHIGNIAGNAYYNGRLLRRRGVEADVLCYDNYWVMSSPEWEEADFEGVPQDQGLPDWSEVGLGDYEHPRWFAQGPRVLAMDYLIAKQSTQGEGSERAWRDLAEARRRLSKPTPRRIHRVLRMPAEFARRVLRKLDLPRRLRLDNYETGAEATLTKRFLARCDELAADFERRFPDREDRLATGDLTPYMEHMEAFEELFSYYDVVQAYATDTVYPMLAGSVPYVGFEHGTLRDAPEWEWEFKGPFWPNPIGRITALSYARADHVFITNADCKSSAERLELASYTGIPHPIADDLVFRFDAVARESIRAELDADHVFLCPIRHDWVEKGTDRYIRAIPALRERLGEGIRVLFTPWGREIERSKELIAELGVEDQVMWVGPFGAVVLTRWLSAVDVVFDQLTYESFSGMTPRALACGTPIVARYAPDGAAWMFPEPAPVLDASSVEDVVEQAVRAVDPEFRERFRRDARAWVDEWHSSLGISDTLLRVYHRILDRQDAGILEPCEANGDVANRPSPTSTTDPRPATTPLPVGDPATRIEQPADAGREARRQ
ncbi:MAG: glycosyltransferase [Planctomycetes bacterium]|nr:glycosyltransferase [Planctomycetota bacterium]